MDRTPTTLDTTELPRAIAEAVDGAELFDSSCSETARTILVQTQQRCYLKIREQGALAHEAAMCEFFNAHGLGPRVIASATSSGRDYLLVEALFGEDGTHRRHLARPERLAKVYGESLRLIHELPVEGCPFRNQTTTILNEVRANAKEWAAEGKLTSEQRDALDTIERHAHTLREDIVMHGDYCLPNILLENFTLSGFVDFDYGGVGDRHWDLFWGIWTLGYNLKTDAYGDVFLDAYGRTDVDVATVELCGKMAWFIN